MPRAAAAAASRLLLVAQRAWVGPAHAPALVRFSPATAASSSSSALLARSAAAHNALAAAAAAAAPSAAAATSSHAGAATATGPLLAAWAPGAPHNNNTAASFAPPSGAASSFSSVSEAAARARRLAAAQARRQQQHERAAARLARASASSPQPAAAAAAAADDDGAQNSALVAPATPSQKHDGPLVPVDPGGLRPADAAAVARAVSHPALVVTRAVEWGTVVFGFEQANKYTVYDQDGRIVCLIAEDETGLGNALGRQLLRTRRAFTATVLSPDDGAVLFRVRRPAYLVSSTTYVEAQDGTPVGEVRQRWHPLRRSFDLYVQQQQYARISGPLLAWEFALMDDRGATLALIDRNFQGFARELFTDAGKYVVHFGHSAEDSAAMATRTLEARTGGNRDFPPVRPLALGPGGGGTAAGVGHQQQEGAAAAAAAAAASGAVAAIPQVTGGQLAVARPLALDERMVALAAAIAIDFAFFSQHSHTSGMFAPPLIFPMPFPGGGVGGAAAEEAAGGEGAAPTGGGGAEGAAGAGVGGGGGGGDAGLGGGGFGGPAAGTGASSSSSAQQDDGWSWADDGGEGAGGGGGGEAGGGDSGWSDAWGGGDDAGDDGEGGGTVGSVVRGLWRVFGDDD